MCHDWNWYGWYGYLWFSVCGRLLLTSTAGCQLYVQFACCGLWGWFTSSLTWGDNCSCWRGPWRRQLCSAGYCCLPFSFSGMYTHGITQILFPHVRHLQCHRKSQMLFCGSDCFFLFLYSILGMQLFGGKFSFITQKGETITHRKNFDTLLSSTVTVFQVCSRHLSLCICQHIRSSCHLCLNCCAALFY